MGNLFTGSEIVKVGIKIEENGRDFYNALINKFKGNDSVEVYKYLAGEEEKHIAAFKGILEKQEKSEQTESYSGEYLDYMKVLADSLVFTQERKGEEVAKSVNSDKEAIQLGINFEKDSIIFYEGMKKVMQGRDLEAIEALVEQERQHLKKLIELKKVVSE